MKLKKTTLAMATVGLMLVTASCGVSTSQGLNLALDAIQIAVSAAETAGVIPTVYQGYINQALTFVDEAAPELASADTNAEKWAIIATDASALATTDLTNASSTVKAIEAAVNAFLQLAQTQLQPKTPVDGPVTAANAHTFSVRVVFGSKVVKPGIMERYRLHAIEGRVKALKERLAKIKTN